MMAERVADGDWGYTPLVAEIEVVALHTIKEYFQRRQATIVAQVAYGLIYEQFTEAERRLGTSRMMKWWDQDMLHESEE